MTRSSIRLSRIACLAVVFLAATTIAASAQTFTTLANLDGKNGQNPVNLVQGLDGNFYGTSQAGGFFDKDRRVCRYHCGTIFKVTPSGEATLLYSFCARQICADGAIPTAAMVLASDGNFYGTTEYGGQYGQGTVFKFTPAGVLTTLYSFCAVPYICPDGGYPVGGMVQGLNGSLYGTTSGAARSGSAIFSITPTGILTTLYSFCKIDCSANTPQSTLVLGTDGNIYGVTSSFITCSDCGTAFEVTSAGQYSTLYTFCDKQGACPNGSVPGSLLQAANGNLYGTDAPLALGEMVFEMTTSGTMLNIYDVSDSSSDDYGSLLQATDGNLYGADFGYLASYGAVFELTATGESSTLHNFCSTLNNKRHCVDGYGPAGLIQATDGNFYGTTYYGGANSSCVDSPYYSGCGTIFRISTGLQPFVTTVPVMGSTGTNVILLGHNFTGSTGVTFNGVAASFTVVSDTEITATVPAGAATGVVEVNLAHSVLQSNKNFVVTQ